MLFARQYGRPKTLMLEQIGKAAEETPTEPAGSAAVISGVLDRLWQNQRQSMTVLFAGIVFAMLFGTYVTLSMGPVAGAEWFACYVIFDYFKVTGERQSQVLNYGVAGAVILRFLFVYLGAQLLQRFDFLILAFSVILIWASYQAPSCSFHSLMSLSTDSVLRACPSLMTTTMRMTQ
eukprot:g10482.t1